MKINYDHRIFKAESNSPNGQVDETVRFYYFQKEDVLFGHYQGGKIKYGQIIGKVGVGGKIEMRYQHIDIDGEMRTGICSSFPSLSENGKVRLHETWHWINGDGSKGESVLIETDC